VNFILNAEPGSFAATFAEKHGPSAPAMAFRVVDAGHAYQRALSLGAKPAEITPARTNSRSRRSLGLAACKFTWSINTEQRGSLPGD
jgi:4-hydroxyphenylpyruvate dioxygenase-like putative hemolysin